MPQWVKDLINAATAGMRALADAAMERILWVYNVVVLVSTAVRVGWGFLTRTSGYWIDAAFRFATKVHGTLWYIIYIRIPQMVGNAVNAVIQWSIEVISEVDRRLTAIITASVNWLWERIIEVVDFGHRLRDWIFNAVTDVWDTLSRVAELVFLLLTSPHRMAAWVAGALLQYVLAFLWDNAESLLEFFRQRATTYAGLIAARIEQVLVRLL